MPRFDAASDDVDILAFLHDVADAAADTLDEAADWSETGGHEGQLAGDVLVDDVVTDLLEVSGFVVLSEESGMGEWDRAGGQLLVVVDPVDGSTNAARGLPWYATSLCVVDADGPRVALVAEQSGSETRYSAIRGQGARCDGTRMAPSGLTDAARAVVGVNGPLAPGHGWWQVRTMGAAALDVSLVGKGALDGYIDTVGHGCWDYLAALLVCREAGAIVVDALGRNIVTLDPTERRMPLAAPTAEMLESLRRAWAASRA